MARSKTISSHAVNPTARKLVDFFSGADRPADAFVVGRKIGRWNAKQSRQASHPAWLGPLQSQVYEGLCGGWSHPMSHIQPVVIDTTGGPAQPRNWRQLPCATNAKLALHMSGMWTEKNGDEVVQITFRCPHARPTTLVAIMNVQGHAKEAFGLTHPTTTDADKMIAPAALHRGHSPIFQLRSNYFLAQVHWLPKPKHDPSVLPGTLRFSVAAPRLIRRGLWLFSPTGRPLHALYGPTTHVAPKSGLLNTPMDRDGTVTIEQLLADGRKLMWSIDKTGAVRQKSLK